MCKKSVATFLKIEILSRRAQPEAYTNPCSKIADMVELEEYTTGAASNDHGGS